MPAKQLESPTESQKLKFKNAKIQYFSLKSYGTLKMSFREVVANLDETPSSQERAFWRETSGAADIKSEPTATEAYPLEAWNPLTMDFKSPVRFSNAEEAMALSVFFFFFNFFFFFLLFLRLIV